MMRRSFVRDGLNLSYLDQGGAGEPVVALHAYWMEAGTYADLAKALAPKWRNSLISAAMATATMRTIFPGMRLSAILPRFSITWISVGRSYSQATRLVEPSPFDLRPAIPAR